ncbi:hypothetical protein CCH79_00016931 [Gambusia affinis]|uniref:Uncharacterized protein n=1 Tax=Gambusia affinis TaxID=33528 RepID=A0A315UPY2_GAMAF|nr:hypothetical protein CCH79_00016931 [Gambusia affinis]
MSKDPQSGDQELSSKDTRTSQAPGGFPGFCSLGMTHSESESKTVWQPGLSVKYTLVQTLPLRMRVGEDRSHATPRLSSHSLGRLMILWGISRCQNFGLVENTAAKLLGNNPALQETLPKSSSLAASRSLDAESCVLSFLKTLDVKVPPTETITFYTFLHYLMQDFFAALWLLKNPDKIREVFQQCLTEEKKHMKHLIPFMCRLLNEKSPRLMSCLIPAEEIKETSGWFFKEMIDTFFHQAVANISELHVDTLFVYQCLFESQSSEVCISFLDKLDYHLDLSRANLDSYSCCAVAYVVTQSKGRKISLNLQDVTITAQGMRHLFACLQNVEWYEWKYFVILPSVLYD